MTNYQIITDRTELDKFINTVLPDLREDECYYCCLFARSKYAKNEDGSNKFPHIKTDKSQLKRFTVNKKEDIYWKLKQLEASMGAYRTKDGDAVPQEALAAYITINPRSQQKALIDLLKQVANIIGSKGVGFNIHQEALSCIQRSKSRTVYVDFDIDTKDVDLKRIEDILSIDAYKIVETRGGYHVLVMTDMIKDLKKKMWHYDIRSMFNVDQTGDNMIPIPGTYQGGFTPKIIK